MNRLFMIVGGAVLVAVVGFALLGARVQAQDATDTEPTSGISGYMEQMWNAVAEKLGVDRSELDSAVEDARADVAAKAVEDGKLTQEQADRISERPFGGHFGMKAKRFGFHGGMEDCHGDYASGVAKSGIAEDLGLTADELAAELEAGKTIDEIAEAQGVDLQAARNEMMQAQIQQAVEDGKLTQEQADWMIEGLEKGLTPGLSGKSGFRGMPQGFGGFDRGSFHHRGFGHGDVESKGFWFDRNQDESTVPSELSNS